MYNPQSHQWSLYWGGATQGALSLPAVVGEFKDGVGEFYDQEEYQGANDLCSISVVANHF